MLQAVGRAYDKYVSEAPRPEPVAAKPATLAACLSNVEALRDLIANARGEAAAAKQPLPDLPEIYRPLPEQGPRGQELPGRSIHKQTKLLWASAAIDALTVHVVDNRKVHVTIPLNWCICMRIYQDVYKQMGLPLKYADDCNYLAGLLAREAMDVMGQMRNDSGEKLRCIIWRHKKSQYVKDDMEFVVAQCRSDRPAFVVTEEEGNPDLPELYLYNAMGLQRQHEQQVVLLGRCASFGAAAALLKAATSTLLVHYRADRVRFWAESSEELQSNWAAACRSAGLTEGKARRRVSEAFNDRAGTQGLLADTAKAHTIRQVEPFLRALRHEEWQW